MGKGWSQPLGPFGAALLMVGVVSCSDVCSDGCCQGMSVETLPPSGEERDYGAECEEACEKLIDDADAAGCDAEIDALEECVDGDYDCDTDGSLQFGCDVQMATGCVTAAGSCSVEITAVRACRAAG